MAKKIVVLKPPPIFHAKYEGTRMRMEMSKELEKPSDPAVSAGSGAFFIDAYYGYCYHSGA